MHTRRSLAVTLAPLITVACGGAAARPSATPAPPATPTVIAPPSRSAGDVGAAATPDRSAAELARLRAQGPAALDALLAAYDRAPAGAARDRLAATIDKVAGQRFATVSRMYWYTDLAQAEAAARASHKPILSLRMLGRLDEDLSCANSRFFRTILYANATLGPWLRDHFVLHWSSERPVPKVTIDFGDGRVLERTVTGNSAHFVLDADGHPLDVLPGLYAPSAFRAELGRSLALAEQVRQAPAKRVALVAAYHQRRLVENEARWKRLGPQPVIYGRRGLLRDADVDSALATAQGATMSKAMIEVPDLRIVDVGSDPGALAPDLELWAVIGQRLYGWGAPSLPAQPAPGGSRFGLALGTPPVEPARPVAHAAPAPLHLLDAQSIALITGLVSARRPTAPMVDADVHRAMLARLDQTLAADSAQNELVLRREIDQYFGYGSEDRSFDQLDEYLYTRVFHTPASDPWLGLLTHDAFTGLPADGVREPR